MSSACIKKKNLPQLVNFCVAISIQKTRKKQQFWPIMLYFKKGKNTPEVQKDLCSVWRSCCDWLKMSKVVCELLCWRFLAGWYPTVRQNSWSWQQWNQHNNWENNRYTTGDRQPTYSKYLNQALKIIYQPVMLIALVSGFYISCAKKPKPNPSWPYFCAILSWM